jgi:alkaline phosphatase
MMRRLPFLFAFFLSMPFNQLKAQKKQFTVANAHSHNDYEQAYPFSAAYGAQFGSMEADIFLWHDSLIVGHTTADIPQKRTLQDLYLNPLQRKTILNNGYPYPDTSRNLQLLIDIKTAGAPTLNRLVAILKDYSLLTSSAHIQFVISGNRPAADSFQYYPNFIWFDGELDKNYPASALQKIVLLSDDFAKYIQWNGQTTLLEKDRMVMVNAIQRAKQLGKKVRFWNAPDTQYAWSQLINAGVDYVNTDRIDAFREFMVHLYH